jgi:hypothetical protein
MEKRKGQLCHSILRRDKFFLRCIPSELRKAYRWIHLATESILHANRKQSLSVGNILVKTVLCIRNHGDATQAFYYLLSHDCRVLENVFGIVNQRYKIYHRQPKFKPENNVKLF